jgi:hypothetical protein
VPGSARAFIDLLVAKFGGEPVWDRCVMKYRDPDHPGLAEERAPGEHAPLGDDNRTRLTMAVI